MSDSRSNLAATTRRAYERWAPLYPPVAHNPLMRAEQGAMCADWPLVTERRALDLACGSGRYTRLLRQAGASHIVAVDFCLPMLCQVDGGERVCATMMSLPFRDRSFDLAVAGLAIGHAGDLACWVAEVARVLTAGGHLLYSDFHPEAARAGLTRSFKDENSRTCTVPHTVHEVGRQREAVERAGLQVESMRELRVGRELRESFPGCERFYREWDALPILLIVRARK